MATLHCALAPVIAEAEARCGVRSMPLAGSEGLRLV